MNKTLIIYDNSGVIVSQMVSPYNTPNGLPYLEIEIPSNKYIVGVDIANNQPIYEDMPKSENQIFDDKISILEQGLANAEYALMMGGLV